MVTSVHRRLAVTACLFAVAILAFVAGTPAGAQGNGPPDGQRGKAPAVPAESGPPAGLPSSAPHEIWMLDQGTDLIHVLDERGAEIVAIDVSAGALAGRDFAHEPFAHEPSEGVVPHMIDFDSQHRYAFVAATAGAATIVIDAEAKEVVEVLPTGGGSHMAAVTPDDTAVWVAAIGAKQMVEIEVDLDAEPASFTIGARLDVPDLLAPIEVENPDWQSVDPTLLGPDHDFAYASYSPVCHQYTVGSDGSAEAWVTLGPGWAGGGLFVFDIDTHEVTAAWNPAQVKANCGTVVSPDGEHVVANWSGEVVDGADTEGEWYVFDAATKELLLTESARGLDAHGVRFTPDGKRLWAVNRNSDNGLIIDARTFKVVREIEDVADTPDILDFSPDGRLVYISQRGPAPVSGAPHAAAGGQAGIAVVHAASGRTLRVFEPAPVIDAEGGIQNDIHGLGVRPIAP